MMNDPFGVCECMKGLYSVCVFFFMNGERCGSGSLQQPGEGTVAKIFFFCDPPLRFKVEQNFYFLVVSG